MPQETFSERHGHQAPDAEITVREDAPEELRHAILMIVQNMDMDPKQMRDIVCGVLLKQPDQLNWSPSNVWNEVKCLIESCEWFRVYDIAEKFYDSSYDSWHNRDQAEKFAEDLNRFFREKGIGWEMRDGRIVFRGSEVFPETTAGAVKVLEEMNRPTAANEMREAVKDISRRPEPDTTGAVHHVMAALEAVARDVTGQSNPTLGQLVGKLDLPKPLDAAVEKLWGFASQRARHGEEGKTADTVEAELLVSVAGAVSHFLVKKNQSLQQPV